MFNIEPALCQRGHGGKQHLGSSRFIQCGSLGVCRNPCFVLFFEGFLFPGLLGAGPAALGRGLSSVRSPATRFLWVLSEAPHPPLPFPVCLGEQQRFCEGEFLAVHSPVDRDGKEAQPM